MMPKRANSDPIIDAIYCTDMSNPAYLRYHFPLENVKDEETAWSMAEAIYGAYADHFSPDITEAEKNYVFEQALVDSRRMMVDEEYMRLIKGAGCAPD